MKQTISKGINYLKSGRDNRFAAIFDFITDNMDTKISMNMLAAVAHMSRSHFFRAFKREFGISPNHFILREKITKAKILLQHATPISETAYRTGFSDANYFIKAFKEAAGETPKHFQKKYCANIN